MKLGIDVPTLGMGGTIDKLAALKSTNHVCGGGRYAQDPNYSQIHIDTDLNEAQLELWLYNTKGVAYEGVFVREELAASSPRIVPVAA